MISSTDGGAEASRGLPLYACTTEALPKDSGAFSLRTAAPGVLSQSFLRGIPKNEITEGEGMLVVWWVVCFWCLVRGLV